MEYFDVKDIYFWVKVVQLVILAGSLIFNVVMAIKKKKINFCSFINELEGWIIEAEEHKKYTGAEKLDYVLNKAFKFCTEHHISYNEEQITDKIEQLIELSKKVNKKENPLL